MKLQIFNEANKIWQQFTKDARDKEFILPFAIHKKLLSLFHVGDFYYYVFNIKTSEFEMMSEEVGSVLGYEVDEIDVPFFLSKIHPEDQPYFLNFETKVTELFASFAPKQILNSKVSYDYRVRKKDGNYIRILQQVLAIQLDENKKVIKTLGIHTDITHLKPEGLPVLSIIGLNGQPSYMNINVKKIFSPSVISLTRRERELLALLVKGKTSEQVSNELYISKLTVATHRKNLLRKTGCANTASMTSMAIQKGWL